MKKINLLGCLSMALFFLFISCSEETTSTILTEKSFNADCGECEGQITSLTLEYLGTEVNATVKVFEKDNLVHTFTDLNNGQSFQFVGSRDDNKMGSKIFLTVNDGSSVEIHTSCSVDIFAGMTFGDFLIESGASHGGGALCTTDTPPGGTDDCGECEGQITYLELEYLGDEDNATVVVYEGKANDDKIFQTFYNVNSGDILPFSGAKKDNKMGSKILLSVNDGSPVEIHTSCSVDIFAGMTFGDFLIIAGTSHEGGALCTTDTPPGGSDDCSACEGQMTYLELEYLGDEINATVSIYEGKSDDDDKIFQTFNNVNTGDILSFAGSKKQNKMGSKIFLRINNGTAVELHTSCSQPIYVGMTVGDFVIKAGTSHEGGTLIDENGNCPEEEEEEECMIAFAYRWDGEHKTCFLDDGFTQWGWTNEFTHRFLWTYKINNGFSYKLPIVVEADGCDIPNSIEIGYISIQPTFENINGSTNLMANIKYVITNPNYTLCETNLFLGVNKYPQDTNGEDTISTSEFGLSTQHLNITEFIYKNVAWPTSDKDGIVNFIGNARVDLVN